MTTRRMFVMAGGALAPVLLLTLLFNNQWVIDAIRKSDFEYDEGIGPLVSWFQFPQWRLTGGGVHAPGKFIFAVDFGTLLFFVLLALLALAASRPVEPRRGLFGAVVAGWWATVVAGGLSGIVLGVLIDWSLDLPGGAETGRTIWNTMSHGASFGLAYGWLPGIGALVGFLLTRPADHVQQPVPGPVLPPGGPVPYGAPGHSGAHLLPGAQPPQPQMQPGRMHQGQMQSGAHMQPGQMQPGMPMAPSPHAGQGLPPQHPAAVPYVPPPGPQQPQWAGAPLPPQAPQYPGAPVPPQPGPGAPQQQFQPSAPPPAAQAPSPPVPTPAPPADDDAAEPAEAPRQDEPAEPAEPAEAADRPRTEAETAADGTEDDAPGGEAGAGHGPDDDRPLAPPR
ncbi:hypothetical protein AGRA3207_001826 [Actinomadura graeca]|uniref:Uncharacterized protein n=1 Tax=Actinomadura graeca TaxID=2750812 RepID=A0ABX8QQF1_9ACTN|nr:hypothetical protein [Actinomadura graeca]QXJ21020.1 hypothetical protein AGRA3207_001826 [Actinomadura graeca]